MNTPPIDVVGRVAAVLRAASLHEPGGATTSTVARDAGLPRPTTHRLLVALQDHGLIDRDEASGLWLLGAELFLLGTAAAARYDVTEVAAPFVRRLALATEESAFFSARRGDETVCLLREDGAFPLRSHVLWEGARFPLGVVSAGLVVLSHLPDAEIEHYLQRANLEVDWGAQHSGLQIRKRIIETRATGFAVNPGLVVEGSWGLAAAVFDNKGRPRWALTLTGVEARFGSGRLPELGALLLREAHALSGRLADR